MESILENIGNTPLVKLNKIPQSEGIQCTVYAKCEFFNAGGSVKDRIGREMVLQAEKDGILTPGCTLIEPTSGNTGIGIALCAAVKGYKCIITMPEKMSMEKVRILKALGAEIIRTPTEAAWDSPESHISVAKRLNKKIPNSVILDQYRNPNNPLAHYKYTAEEIWTDTKGKVDMFVAGAGTGGTLSGTARRLRELNPDIQIIGVDPVGSILAQPESLNTGECAYKVEGIGYDFIPQVLDRSLVSKWYKSEDQESFHFARRLMKEEGLLCGGSCGSAMAKTIQAIKESGMADDPSKTVVVLLADSIRNYMSKYLSDEWMQANGFMERTQSPITLDKFDNCLVGDIPIVKAVTVKPMDSVQEAIALMKSKGFDQLPVVEEEYVKGIVTLGNLLSKLSKNKVHKTDPLTKVMFTFDKTKKYVPMTPQTPLKTLATFFDSHSAAIISENGKLTGILTKIDLLDWLTMD